MKSFCKPATCTDREALYYCWYVYTLLFNPAAAVWLLLACTVHEWFCNLREALHIYHRFKAALCQTYWPALQKE